MSKLWYINQAAMAGGGAAVPWYLVGGIPLANCIAAYQPKGAASYNASLINLITAGTYDAAAGSDPAWTTGNGWAGATGKYLVTGIIPDSYNWSMISRHSGVSALNNSPCGSRSGSATNTFYTLLVNTNNVRYTYGYANSEIAPVLATGTLAIAGIYGYRNGVLDSTGGAQTNGIPSKEIYLMGINNNGSVGFSLSDGYLMAVAIYNAVLSNAQILAVHTAMMAL